MAEFGRGYEMQWQDRFLALYTTIMERDLHSPHANLASHWPYQTPAISS